MEKSYAQALWSMVEGGTSPSKAVHALQDMLTREGRAGLMPRIARAFARLAEREGNKNNMVLTVAREKDERHGHKEVVALLEKLGATSHDLKTQVDDTLIGGWRLEGRGMLVDNSYKTKLLTMYHRVISA